SGYSECNFAARFKGFCAKTGHLMKFKSRKKVVRAGDSGFTGTPSGAFDLPPGHRLLQVVRRLLLVACDAQDLAVVVRVGAAVDQRPDVVELGLVREHWPAAGGAPWVLQVDALPAGLQAFAALALGLAGRRRRLQA